MDTATLTHLYHKGSAVIGSIFSGALGYVGAAVTGIASESPGGTAAIVAAASILGALFTKLPDILRAMAERKKVEVSLHDEGQIKLIEQIYAAQDRERAVSEKLLERTRDRADRLEAESAVLRETKHLVLNECSNLVLTIRDLQDQMRLAKLNVPEFTPPDLASILRAEDTAMKRLNNAP